MGVPGSTLTGSMAGFYEYPTDPDYIERFYLGDIVSMSNRGYPTHARGDRPVIGYVYRIIGNCHPSWYAAYQREFALLGPRL